MAQTAAEWRTRAIEMQTTSRGNPPCGLQALLQQSLSNTGDQSCGQRLPSVNHFKPNPFTVYILIQALLSYILELRDSIPSTYSKAIYRLKMEELEGALNHWLYYFNRMDPTDRANEMAQSALASFHFAFIFLRIDLGDVLRATSTVCSGSTVTSSAKEGQLNFSGDSEFASKAVSMHSLKIIGLCLDDRMSLTRSVSKSQTAFIAVLILWAHMVVLQRQAASQPCGHHRTVNTGFGSDAQAVTDIARRRENLSGDSLELDEMKRDAHDLIQRVRGRLVESFSDNSAPLISCDYYNTVTDNFTVQEACQILDILLQDENFDSYYNSI